MPELRLLTQHRLAQVLGAASLLRFVRAGWLTPAQRTPSRVLFRLSDVNAALRRLDLYVRSFSSPMEAVPGRFQNTEPPATNPNS
jgi:hypothetical protein